MKYKKTNTYVGPKPTINTFFLSNLKLAPKFQQEGFSSPHHIAVTRLGGLNRRTKIVLL